MSGNGDRAKGADAGEVEEKPIPLATEIAVYATGAFGNSINNVITVVMPLWALHLGASPLMIGIIVGARHTHGPCTRYFNLHPPHTGFPIGFQPPQNRNRIENQGAPVRLVENGL